MTSTLEPRSSAAVEGGAADKSHLRHEYERSLDVLKLYMTLHFAQLSVFIAINGAAVAFLFREQAQPLESIAVIAAELGITVVALLFWIMEESRMYVISHFLRRSAKLEIALGYRGFSVLRGMPEYRYSPSKWALRGFYVLVMASWAFLSGRTVLNAVN